MKTIDIIGEAFVKEHCPSDRLTKGYEMRESYFLSNGYKPYYFLGKNIKISKEVVEECGAENFFFLRKGDNALAFIKSDFYTTSDAASECAPLLSREMNWNDPMFIIDKYSSGWTIRPTSEGEKYLD